ncbi:hypothetical protein D3C83_143510 [compost metagenome]
MLPRSYSNFSTAFISPMFPSWMRSMKEIPWFRYFFAMWTTRRRLARISASRAWSTCFLWSRAETNAALIFAS